MAIPAIVLAAGGSRRLGQPKQLVRVGDETLLGRTLRVVRGAGADPVLVVLGAERAAIQERVGLGRAIVVDNPEWELGIATSIRAGVGGLLEMQPDCEAVLLLVCDQPKLTAGHLLALVEAFRGMDEPGIVASRYAGVAGIPAIFPRGQFGRLLALEGDAGARYLLRNPDCGLVTVEFAGGEVDVDLPEDLDRLPG